MHFVFIPYGKRECVERLLRDMEAQKHSLPLWKDEKKQNVWIDGQIRLLPFGVHEYVFPKENLDKVLATLILEDNRYNLPLLYFKLLRKAFRLKKLPKFKRDNIYIWQKANVNIIPLGIREDAEQIDNGFQWKGWYHEAI